MINNIKIKYEELNLCDIYKMYFDDMIKLPDSYVYKVSKYYEFKEFLDKSVIFISAFYTNRGILEIFDGKKRMKKIFDLFNSYKSINDFSKIYEIHRLKKSFDIFESFYNEFIESLKRVKIILLTLKGNGGSLEHTFNYESFYNE